MNGITGATPTIFSYADLSNWESSYGGRVIEKVVDYDYFKIDPETKKLARLYDPYLAGDTGEISIEDVLYPDSGYIMPLDRSLEYNLDLPSAVFTATDRGNTLKVSSEPREGATSSVVFKLKNNKVVGAIQEDTYDGITTVRKIDYTYNKTKSKAATAAVTDEQAKAKILAIFADPQSLIATKFVVVGEVEQSLPIIIKFTSPENWKVNYDGNVTDKMINGEYSYLDDETKSFEKHEWTEPLPQSGYALALTPFSRDNISDPTSVFTATNKGNTLKYSYNDGDGAAGAVVFTLKNNKVVSTTQEATFKGAFESTSSSRIDYTYKKIPKAKTKPKN